MNFTLGRHYRKRAGVMSQLFPITAIGFSNVQQIDKAPVLVLYQIQPEACDTQCSMAVSGRAQHRGDRIS